MGPLRPAAMPADCRWATFLTTQTSRRTSRWCTSARPREPRPPAACRLKPARPDIPGTQCDSAPGWPIQPFPQSHSRCSRFPQRDSASYTGLRIGSADTTREAVTTALLRGRTDTPAPPPLRPDQPPPPDPGMVPLTVPQVKRLLAAMLTRPHPPGHADRRLDRKRRHQAPSRWYHQRTRLARDTQIALVSRPGRADT